eukprot:TRINITY_DN93315_c0_g1_i1.p1 TRINITY_DN93315_c0_g1~~TRINITY_DN93315_c0_g1_i1.p1  ORF type:complete len:486 (+),score=102.79 TRINITY_DN93315_c0_g1_i1:21-1478(+)
MASSSDSSAGIESETHPLRNGSGIRRPMSPMGRSMLQGAFPEEMEMLEPTINVLMYFKEAPPVHVLANAMERHLWPSYRFHSCMDEAGYWVKAVETPQMDRSYHFRELSLQSEEAIDAWVQKAMVLSLDRSFPPWQVTFLRTPKGPGLHHRDAMWCTMHHTVADGLGLIIALAPMLSCAKGDVLSNIPLPAVLLPPSARKPAAEAQQAKTMPSEGCCASCCLCLKGAFTAPSAVHDSELCFNEPLQQRSPFLKYNGSRIYMRLPPVSMQAVKAVRERYACTVNDAIMAALTGALRKYGGEVRGDARLRAEGEKLEFKCIMMMALPRPIEDNDPCSALVNKELFVSCPLPIDDATEEGRMGKVMEAMSKLKSKGFMAGYIGFTNFLTSVAPSCLLRKAAAETFSKHSILVTQVPSTTCPLKFPAEGGQEMQEPQMVFPNCITQCSIITYNGEIHANLVADPKLFFPEHKEILGKLWASEFERLAKA